MKETPSQVDVAILGAGTAGLSARKAVQRAGVSLALVDSGPFGTTCARVGCMPSKLLVAAADAAHRCRSASLFGVRAGEVQVDGRAVMERLRRERDRFVGSVLNVVDEARRERQLFEGCARLVGNGRLQVEGHGELRFERLVVATGTRPVVPPPFRGLESTMLTYENVFELERLPESLLVVGLGAIGLELGQAMARLGVRTTLLGEDGDVGPLTDPAIREVAREVLSSELDLHSDYQLHHLEPVERGCHITFTDSEGKRRDLGFERVLVAAGRKPRLDQLGLQALGVEPDEQGEYPVDPRSLQLSDRPVFVAGDANGLHPLLHEASDDGRIAGNNAAVYPHIRPAERRARMVVLFSDPQVGVVGETHAELQGRDVVSGEVSFADQGRARVQGANQGKARLYAERDSGCLLGAELFGPSVEHLAHLLAWTVQRRMTVNEVLSLPFYHPCIEEGLRTALKDLSGKLQGQPALRCRVSELGVGS